MQQNKIEAIYALRDAAEKSGSAATRLDEHPSPAARDALLAARLQLEAKTQDAIEACHECGHIHGDGDPHGAAGGSNVIDVDFRPADEGK